MLFLGRPLRIFLLTLAVVVGLWALLVVDWFGCVICGRADVVTCTSSGSDEDQSRRPWTRFDPRDVEEEEEEDEEDEEERVEEPIQDDIEDGTDSLKDGTSPRWDTLRVSLASRCTVPWSTHAPDIGPPDLRFAPPTPPPRA